MSQNSFCKKLKLAGEKNFNCVKIYQYTCSGDFIAEHLSILHTANLLGISPASITSCLTGKSKSCNNSQWFYEFKGEKIEPIKRKNNSYTGILMLDKKTKEVLNSFGTVRQAVNFLGKKDNATIVNCCNNKRKSAFGYCWKYKELI